MSGSETQPSWHFNSVIVSEHSKIAQTLERALCIFFYKWSLVQILVREGFSLIEKNKILQWVPVRIWTTMLKQSCQTYFNNISKFTYLIFVIIQINLMLFFGPINNLFSLLIFFKIQKYFNVTSLLLFAPIV